MREGVSVVGINWSEVHKCDAVSLQGHLLSKFNSTLVLR